MEGRRLEKGGTGGFAGGAEPIGARSAHGGGSSRSLWLLAARAADEGDYERIPALFAAAREAGLSSEDAARWRRLLIEAGHFELAAAVSGRTAEEPAAADEGGAQHAGEESDDVLDFEPGARSVAAPLVAPEIVASFLRWFAGRGDVYARQWYDARRDRSGYWPVREPLTAAVVEQHLLGRFTLGQYVLHPDNTVSFAALDLDPTPEAIEHARLASESQEPAPPAMLDYAARIREQAERSGLPLFIEHSGGAGLHLWLFFAPRLPAERARGFLRELLWRAGAQPPSVAVEIFPKQDRLGGKGLGNLIKLPLGIHQVTLRPSSFLDAQLRPIGAAEALALLRPVPPAALEELQKSRIVPLQPRETAEKPEPLRAPESPTPRALAASLAAIPAGKEATAAADRILAGCAVLRELARRAHEGPPLSADAARALLYSVGLVGRENERIESLFANAGVSRKELERVRRGLQAPIGCKRLRERFADLGAQCSCPPAPDGGYATPALFAFRQAPSFERRGLPAPELAELARGEHDASLVEVEQRLARIESALAKLVTQDTGDPSDP
jgi:hypothetical protein